MGERKGVSLEKVTTSAGCTRRNEEEKYRLCLYKENYTIMKQGKGIRKVSGDKKTISVTLMGKFQIEGPKGALDEKSIHSKKGMKLLVYLLLHRKRPVSCQELGEAIWSEGQSENPAGVLKNLIYRLRNSLKAVGDEAYIVSSHGLYGWNKEIPVVIDVERFEEACERTRKVMTEDIDTKKKEYEYAVKCYTAEMVDSLQEETWMISEGTYYHSLYMNMVKQLADIYQTTKEFEKMTELCRTAVAYDALDEELHYWIVKGLAGQGKDEMALDYYESSVKLLQERLGIKTMEKLKSAYREICQNRRLKKRSMEDVFQEFQEKEEPRTVFFCEYEIFQQIYRMEARRLDRLGLAEYVMLMTVNVRGKELDEEERALLGEKAMKRLKEIICNSLRIGDVVSEYSETQYVLLLPACTYEDCAMIARRLCQKFRSGFKSVYVEITYDMEEVSLQGSGGIV